jgi:hypothetical protein
MVEKPDGKYIRIRYAKKTTPGAGIMPRLGEIRQRMWKRPVVKTVVIAVAAAILANIIILAVT